MISVFLQFQQHSVRSSAKNNRLQRNIIEMLQNPASSPRFGRIRKTQRAHRVEYCRSRNMQNSEPPEAEKLFLRVDTAEEDLPECATYLPPTPPPG